MSDSPGDTYNLRIDSDSPLRVRAVMASKKHGITTAEMTVTDLRLVAVRRSDGGYSFRNIKARVEQ